MVPQTLEVEGCSRLALRDTWHAELRLPSWGAVQGAHFHPTILQYSPAKNWNQVPENKQPYYRISNYGYNIIASSYVYWTGFYIHTCNFYA